MEFDKTIICADLYLLGMRDSGITYLSESRKDADKDFFLERKQRVVKDTIL